VEEMTIVVLAVVIFGAFVSLFLAVGAFATAERPVRVTASEAGRPVGNAARTELAVPFVDRIAKPAVRTLGEIARRLSPQGLVRGVKHRLVLAGRPLGLDVDRFMAAKALSSILALVLIFAIIMAMQVSISRLLLGAAIGAAAFFLPDLWLRGKVNDRKRAIRVALPDTLDLLTISVEAGLGFDSALSRVVANTKGQLADEFFRMLQEISLGTPRAQAFRNLGKRTEVLELDSFIIAMLQADVFGISIGKVLRVQAHEMRTKRRQRAEEAAMKTPVKIVFPLVLCIFPALMVILLGPAAINIYRAMVGTF
jgi:tight adherence protein C